MNTPAPAPRSSFVTVLAWVMLAFGAFGVLMALLQFVLINMLLPGFASGMPLPEPFGALSIAFFRIAMLFSLAFSVFMAYAAWALLKRRNWARILFIVLFIFSAVMHVLAVAAFVFGFSLVGSLPAGNEFLPPEFQSVLRAMAIAFAIFLAAMAVGYIWLVRRLCAPAIAAEFMDSGAAR